MSDIATDTFRRVFELGSKEHYRIGPDRDALRCVEILYVEDVSKPERCLTVSPDMARQIAAAMVKCAEEIEIKRMRK